MLLTIVIIFLFFLYLSLIGYLLTYSLNIHYGYLGLRLPVNFAFGLLATCYLLLGFSLFTNIDLFVALIILLIVSLTSIKTNKFKAFLIYFNDLKVNYFFILASLISASVVVIHPVIWGDTHLYHYPLVKWLSYFGLVPGLSLVQEAFANHQGWYTILALADKGILEGRIGAFGGALSCFFIFLTTAICLTSLKAKKNSYASYFLVVCLSAFYLSLINYHNILSSLSPDLISQSITILLCYLYMLKGYGQKKRLKLAFIMSLLCLSLRLSTIPLSLFFFFLLFYNRQQTIKKLLLSTVVCLMPAMLAGLITSGTMFYPSPILHFNFSFSLPYEYVTRMNTHIRDYARWCGNLDFNQDSPFLAWVIPWLNCEYFIKNLLIITSISWFFLLFFIKKLPKKAKHILIFQIMATWFVLIKAPATRYASAYLLIALGLSLALIIKHLKINYKATILSYSYPFILGLAYLFLHPVISKNLYNQLFFKQYKAELYFKEGSKAHKLKNLPDAYILMNKACSLNKSHKAACFSKNIILSELSLNEINELKNKPTPIIKPELIAIPFLIPELTIAKEKRAKYSLIKWQNININIPSDLEPNILCSAIKPPCIFKEILKGITLRKPEVGIKGGFKSL